MAKYKIKEPLTVIEYNPSQPLEFVIRNYALSVFKKTDFHVTLTAAILEIDRKTLYNKLQRWESEGYLCRR